MKKLAAVLLALLLLCPCALAENALEAPFAPGTPEAAAAALAAEALGLPLRLKEDADVAGSVNDMLETPGALLCADQAALIASLQGYTAQDLRTAMRPVCKFASSPLYLVMNGDAARELGISDAETLLAYIAENEYELVFARHIEADVIDRAVTKLADEIAVLTDYFLEEEIPDALADGEAHAAVLTGTALEEGAEGLLLICSLGAERSEGHPELPCAAELGLPVCQPVSLYLFTRADTGLEAVESAAAACGAVAPERVSALPGLCFDFLSGEAVEEEIRETFADYKKYMTAEGLFFYEE